VAADLDRLVFVDGKLDERWSRLPDCAAALSAGAEVPLGDVVQADVGGFQALNLATFADGAVIRIAGRRERPIAIVHVSTGQGRVLASVRHRIALAAGAEATIVAAYQGAGTSLISAATEIALGDGAVLSYGELQDEAVGAHHVHHVGVQFGRDSRFDGRWIALGGAVARTEVHSRLAQGSTVDLAGLTLARGQQHVDHHTVTRHEGPHASSRQLFKGILDDRARGVYTGRVIVPRGAVGSDVIQSNPTLLLSDTAIASARPQLEILCDDVKAAHGASVGRLDAEALFYLQARGIGLVEAQSLLTGAFASEIVSRLPEALREVASARVSQWLQGGEA
jgi:Fe-S cluster assembly protein SufD